MTPTTRLILTGAGFESQSCGLPNGTHRVGRAPQNDIVIQDESISAEHCELLVHGVEVIVRELGSRNGTFVNGVQVKAQSGVLRRQVLRFGRVEATIEYPEIVDESSTDNTAVFTYRKVADPLAESEAAPASLPVVFRPRTPISSSDPTITLPRSSAPAASVLPGRVPSPDAPPANGSRWLWVLLTVLIVGMGVLGAGIVLSRN
jgi:predicted component of type VI protein secretion system